MPRGPDILPVQSIPLSAVSDQPVDDVPRPPINASNNSDDLASGVAKEISAEELAIAAAARKGDPDTAEIKEPAAKPKVDAAAKDGDVDPDAEPVIGEDGQVIDPTKFPNYAVKEIAKIRKATRERIAAAQAEAKQKTDELEAARKELEALKANGGKPEQKVEEKPDLRPALEDYDDPASYDEALLAWTDREADRKAAVKIAEREAADKKARDDAEAATKAEADEKIRVAREAELQAISDNWDTAVAAAKEEKYPDWDAVVLKPDADGGPVISDIMGAVMVQMPNGIDVAYYLGVNVDEAKRIAGINNPFLQAAEIGGISKQLSQPTRRVAPRHRPIDPVNTNLTPPENPNPDDEDMEAYHARRTAAMAQKRQPFFPAGGLH